MPGDSHTAEGLLGHNRYKNNTKICRFAIVEFMRMLLYRWYSHWLLLVTLHCGSYWLLNHFFQWKLNKIETENCIGIWGYSWCCWKALNELDFVEFISQIFKAKLWKILIFGWILWLEIQTNCKIWVWKEKSVKPSMCSHLDHWHRYASGEQNVFEKSLTELTLCSGQETKFLEHANMIP